MLGYDCAYSNTQVDQLLPQSLIEPFDTLPSQYRHIGHLHEEIECLKLMYYNMAAT